MCSEAEHESDGFGGEYRVNVIFCLQRLNITHQVWGGGGGEGGDGSQGDLLWFTGRRREMQLTPTDIDTDTVNKDNTNWCY